MDTLDTIYSNPELLDTIQKERAHYYSMIQERGTSSRKKPNSAA